MAIKSNLNPKREAEITHKIAALSVSMIQALDELQAETPFAKDFIQESESIIKKCEKILEDCYTLKTLNQKPYLHNLSNKIDTVIRKNFETVVN